MNVCDTGWGWGAKFFDYDNDGFLDLYVANGFFDGQGDYLDDLLPALWDKGENPSDVRLWPPLRGKGIAGHERHVLFHNEHGRTFTRTAETGADLTGDARAVLVGDFDNDGRLDLFITNQNDKSLLLHNVNPAGHHWLEIDLRGKPPNTRAIGARIYATTGRMMQMREVNAGNGFGGQSMTRQHFGLGDSPSVELLKLRWPDGQEQTFRNVATDRLIQIDQQTGKLSAFGGKGNMNTRAVRPMRLVALAALAVFLSPAAKCAEVARTPAFQDVTRGAAVGHRHHGPALDERLRNLGPWFSALGAGGAVADVDNDGFEDIYLTDSLRGKPNVLYHNNGDFTFTEVAERAGVANINDDKNFSTMAIFFDCDNDGYKDLFVGSYFPDVDLTNVKTTKLLQDSWETARNGGSSYLLHNVGGCRFVDRTRQAGVGGNGWTLAVATADIDKDGWLDLYVANGFISAGKEDYIDILMPIILDSDVDLSDTKNWPPLGGRSFSGYERKKLFRNSGHHSFTDVAHEEGVDSDRDGRGVIVADFDNDGAQDIFLLNSN